MRHGINYGKLDNSPRLQRFMTLLRAGGEYTTREIISMANVCNPGTAASELRAQGIKIKCRFLGTDNGSRVYGYQMEVA